MEIELPEQTETHYDPKTKYRYFSIPFDYPDDSGGIVTLLRLKDQPWNIQKEIKSITINFHEKD